MNLAPIVLFVYNRPVHTRRTVEALLDNELAAESNLIIFSDAAKNEEAVIRVEEVREYIKNIKGFKEVQVVKREENLGLASSVIQGVTEIVNKYGKLIVLEDDLITSSNFLTYMNNCLDLYNLEEDVISIHGYVYPVNFRIPEKTFFLKGADCWGWATWKRGWDLFEIDGHKLLNQLKTKDLSKEFNFNDSYPYIQMLENQINGKNDSWAIRWYASAFLNNKYTLYPAKSLVKNIGLDLSGTHSGIEPNFNGQTLSNENFTSVDKIKISENTEAKKSIEQFFRKNFKVSLKQRIKNFISK